jgi:pimeloyl-ACP methyl ester carboxylesterase
VDGSGWEDVYKILKKDGYTVSIVQNPTSSLADDVAATKRALAGQKAPVVLVGHSYGGVVVTEAGNDSRVSTSCFAEPIVSATVNFDESLSRQNRTRHYRE